MKKKRLFIILGIIILLIVIVILNLKFKDQGIMVETKRAEFGKIVSKVSGDGELKAEAQVNLQAQTMGTVEKLFVKEGDLVTKGQLVCLLDSTSSKANLELTQAQFDQTQQAFARSESLFAQKLISPQDYESAKAAFKSAKARLEQAKDSYEKTKITAPISGTVTQVNIEEGEAVMIGTMNNLGTIMMVIADLTKMMGIVDLDETEVPAVKIGAKATITMDAFPDTSFSGVVTKVGYMPKQTITSVTDQTIDFEIEVSLDRTSPELRPGMSINAEIITGEKDSVLVIPVQAAGRRKLKGQETQTCFVVEKGIAKLTAITTGLSSETDIEITSGLTAGQQVITGPYKVLSKLKDGDRVKSEAPAFDKQTTTKSESSPMGAGRQLRRASGGR
jgi:HlyD family secretion protein